MWRRGEALRYGNADDLSGTFLNQSNPATQPRSPRPHLPNLFSISDHADPWLFDLQAAVQLTASRGSRLTPLRVNTVPFPDLTSLSRWKIVAQASCAGALSNGFRT